MKGQLFRLIHEIDDFTSKPVVNMSVSFGQIAPDLTAACIDGTNLGNSSDWGKNEA
jgi:hypothetical protein